MPEKKNGHTDPAKGKIAFDYIKGNFFRSIRADGIIGGVTPNAKAIHMAFFSERAAIPRREVYEISEEGALGPLKEVESRNSIVREMDVDIFMRLEVAESLHQWLGAKIEEAKKVRGLK